MGRPLRIEYPNALYHVMAHGNGRQWLFKENNDYKLFLNLLENAVSKYCFIVYAYNLMKTHYHLLIETPEANLVMGMRYLNGNYATLFNEKYNRKGRVFRPHYKAIMVEKDEYLLMLSRYIHLNPVKAGIVNKPEEYEWSSYIYLIDKTKAKKVEKWFKPENTLILFGSNYEKAREKFKEYVEEGIIGKTEDPLKQVKKGYILGGDAFIKKIEGKIDETGGEIIGIKLFTKKWESEEIINLIKEEYKLSNEEVKRDKKWIKIGMYLIYMNTPDKLKDIGKLYGNLSYKTVSKKISRFKIEIMKNKDLKKILNHLSKKYKMKT